MCLQARGMGVYRSIGRSHCTRSKCLEHGRRPCCCQWCNMLLRVAQCPARHPWGAAGHDRRIGREVGEVELDAELGGRRGWWWVRRCSARARGDLVARGLCTPLKGDAEVRDGSSFISKLALVAPSCLFVPNLTGTLPPSTRAPAPAPPLRLSLPAVRAGLGLSPGRLLGRLRYRSAPRPSPRQGSPGECLSLPHPPVHTL